MAETEGFGRVGPFNSITTIAQRLDVSVTVGPHPHCISPALRAPPGTEGLDQVSIQPADGTIDSCIDWFAVDLYVDPDRGEIRAVTLSLFEP